MTFLFLFLEAVADPGFHRRGANGGADLLFGQVSMKLHGNEESLAGGARQKFVHVDPALERITANISGNIRTFFFIWQEEYSVLIGVEIV